MDVLASLSVQVINGLASASALYLVAVGLAIIFGVSRIVNFAHGAFFMLGLYSAIHLNEFFLNYFELHDASTPSRAAAYWASVVVATLCIAVLAAVLERTLLKRIYALPELFQLLATFAWVLIAQDAALYLWGAEEILGPRAPGLGGVVNLGERSVPVYDVLLMLIAPLLGYALHVLLTRSTLGLQIRATSEDREMAQALGVKQQVLLCATFALGCGLAALGGALQMPREPASTSLALGIVGDAFVVVVVGGMGSLGGAYIAALAIGVLKAVCIWLGTVTIFGVDVPFPKLTLIIEFLLMAAVLAFRPQGLFGRVERLNTATLAQEYRPLARLSSGFKYFCVAFLVAVSVFITVLEPQSYMLTLMVDICISALFALSLHWLLSPAGMPSFGHAALFGVGAYVVGIAMPGMGMFAAVLLASVLAGCVGIATAMLTARMTGVYRAMLTLAIAQLLWSASYQWDDVTGGSNGLTGVWPPAPFDAAKPMLILCLCIGVVLSALSIIALRSRWGMQVRALRDSPMRAASLGLQPLWLRTSSFAASGWLAGLAGALYVCAKGTVSPDVLAVHQSVNGLVMVLLGGVNSLTGAMTGAISWSLLNDYLLRNVPYWRAALGFIIVGVVLFLPNGISGYLEHRRSKKAMKGQQYV